MTPEWAAEALEAEAGAVLVSDLPGPRWARWRGRGGATSRRM